MTQRYITWTVTSVRRDGTPYATYVVYGVWTMLAETLMPSSATLVIYHGSTDEDDDDA